MIFGQRRKPVAPVIKHEIVDLAFIEFLVQMSEKPDADQFLISKLRFMIITEALKTGFGTSIVNLTDKVRLIDFPC